MMPAMRFEKWQALGNDYLIVERAELPFELTPERVQRLCHPHFGPGADGVLELSPPDEPGFVARLRIFNPDGSEAELSGNGAREAILYLRRRGWTDDDEFSIQTKAGPIRPTVVGPSTCRVQMGRAALRSRDFPGGPEDGIGEFEIDERVWRFQHVSIGNPQASIRVAGPNELAGLDLDALGPAIENSPRFPNRTNVSFWCELAPGEIRARIFERGVGETLSSGTGASGAAVAHVLDGGGSPVTVHLDGGELEVEIGPELDVVLTGWALPVYRGQLSAESVAALAALGES
jgi:diaminopimelate epimerase